MSIIPLNVNGQVRSVDWRSSDLPHYGAGEAALKPMLAAVANAIYDATGVRLRRVSFRSDRVLAALKTV